MSALIQDHVEQIRDVLIYQEHSGVTVIVATGSWETETVKVCAWLWKQAIGLHNFIKKMSTFKMIKEWR